MICISFVKILNYQSQLILQIDNKHYASVDHLTNQIENNCDQTFGFSQLVSTEQAQNRFNQKIIDIGSLVELYRNKVR